MFRLAEYTKKAAELWSKVEQSACMAKVDFNIYEEDRKKFQLVFAGQYSAGKSSIVKAITGREDIKIGAGITTEVVEKYPWSEIEVIDTPGIDTEKRPDHDELAYAAISSSDMIVYVITNELFDSNIAAHFRKLAIDRDKAGEMILVINKMTRTAKGNTPEQQEIIRNALRAVVTPYTPEQLDICFMDAKSYLKSLEVRSENPDRADKLLNRSGYNDFVETLNHVVEKKNLASRLTTNLYQLDDFIQNAAKQIEADIQDPDIKALEENYLQQRHVLNDSRLNLQQEISDIFTNAASEIRALGLESADYLAEGCDKYEVQDELNKAIRKADSIIENSQETALITLTNRLNEMGQDIYSIENSEFTKNLKTRLVGRFDSLPENVKSVLSKTLGQTQKASNVVLKNAYNVTAEGGLKLSSFSGSNIHNIVLKAGHVVKYKFEPWQAIKITRGVAVGAQILSVFGIAASVFMQLKSDQDEEDRRIALKTNRQNIRSKFNDAANGLEDHGRAFIKNNISATIDVSINEIDSNIHELHLTKANRSMACREMEKLHYECQQLIRDIHSI